LDDDIEQGNQAAFFWIGLFGIVVTGALIGIGGDNYWGIASHVSVSAIGTGKSRALLGAGVFLVGLCDLLAFGVIFAGAVVVVQRLRGLA
jgi:hypothetical protein